MKLVLIDRDGTLIVEPPDQQIDSLEKLEFIPGVISGLNLLTRAGFTLVMVTNQDGLGTKSNPKEAYDKVQNKIISLFSGEGISFAEVFVCPHLPDEGCKCRKPGTGLVDDYVAETDPDIDSSFVIGDRSSDVIFGKSLGFKTALLGSDKSSEPDFLSENFIDICRYIVDLSRSAVIERITNETTISIKVTLDGKGENTISTGISFFDHMLEQLSKHSGISMNIKTAGDTQIDEHHSVEDTGLALGEAIAEALGDKSGIGRFSFSVPMDEASSEVLLDLSGRSFLKFDGNFDREKVGEFPTELVEDFFRAFSDTLSCTLHIKVQGRNEHHKIESIFKALGLALREAVRIDYEQIGVIPSTKGII